MKTRSFRLLTVLFAVVMLLAHSINTYAAYGNDVTQDGVKAQLFTDKESYSANEPVFATVRVDNYTYRELFVFCNISAPEGVVLGNEVTTYDGVMSDGEGWTSAGGIITRERTGIAGPVATSDNMQAGVWTILTGLAYCGVIALFVYGKNKKIWLPMLLCCVMLGGPAMAVMPAQAANVAGRGDIDVTCTIQYDGKDTEIKARVSYVIYAEDEESEDTSLKPDTSWYTGNETEYTLLTAKDLLGFHKLRANGNTFEGITVKLGRDITINEGTAADIKARGDENTIWAVLNSDNEFKGTFDGQNHTISGIYMQLGKSGNKGMFGTLGDNAVLKDFSLDDSYFQGPEQAKKNTLGAIAGQVTGKNVLISNVMCNAVVEEGDGAGLKWVGGFIGSIIEGAELTMENCIFGGSITVTGDAAGGMIGYVSFSKADITIKNCTNVGTVTAGSNAGDIIGWANKGTILLEDCTGKEDNKENLIGGRSEEEKLNVTIKNTTGETTDPDNSSEDSSEPDSESSDSSQDSGEQTEVFTPDSSWYDENNTIYILQDAEDLAGFQQKRVEGETFAGKTIKLGADITIDKEKYPWPDVSDAYPFKGTFDGQGHTVSGIYMVTPDNYGGMFGNLGNGAIIQNFILKDSKFSGTTTGKHSLGAIAGAISEAGAQVIIKNVTSYATIQGSNGFEKIGGLVGQINAAENAIVTIKECIFNGSVTIKDGGNYAGGIIGYITNSSVTVNLIGCKNVSDEKVTVEKPGGVTGEMVGYANKAREICIKGCSYSGEWLGGMNAEKVTVTSIYGGTADTSWYSENIKEYILVTAEELMGFAELRTSNKLTFEGYTIKLGVDMVINEDTMDASTDTNSAVSWPNLGGEEKNYPFKGTFDGQNHTVSGLYMATTTSNKGMFGALGNSATIKNFTLNNSYFSGSGDGKQALGSIAGTISEAGAQVIIENVTSNATLEGSNGFKYIGGILGLTDAAKSSDTSANVILTNCSFDGSVISDGTDCGGMIGRVTNSTIVINLNACKNTGSINTSSNKGDMIGYANKGMIIITNCTGKEGNSLVGAKNTAEITFIPEMTE